MQKQRIALGLAQKCDSPWVIAPRPSSITSIIFVFFQEWHLFVLFHLSFLKLLNLLVFWILAFFRRLVKFCNCRIHFTSFICFCLNSLSRFRSYSTTIVHYLQQLFFKQINYSWGKQTKAISGLHHVFGVRVDWCSSTKERVYRPLRMERVENTFIAFKNNFCV